MHEYKWRPPSLITSNLGVVSHLREKVELFTTVCTHWPNNQRNFETFWKIQMGAGGADGLVFILIHTWATSVPDVLFQPPQYKNVWLLLHFHCPNLIQMSLVPNSNLEPYREVNFGKCASVWSPLLFCWSLSLSHITLYLVMLNSSFEGS